MSVWTESVSEDFSFVKSTAQQMQGSSSGFQAVLCSSRLAPPPARESDAPNRCSCLQSRRRQRSCSGLLERTPGHQDPEWREAARQRGRYAPARRSRACPRRPWRSREKLREPRGVREKLLCSSSRSSFLPLFILSLLRRREGGM